MISGPNSSDNIQKQQDNELTKSPKIKAPDSDPKITAIVQTSFEDLQIAQVSKNEPLHEHESITQSRIMEQQISGQVTQEPLKNEDFQEEQDLMTDEMIAAEIALLEAEEAQAQTMQNDQLNLISQLSVELNTVSKQTQEEEEYITKNNTDEKIKLVLADREDIFAQSEYSIAEKHSQEYEKQIKTIMQKEASVLLSNPELANLRSLDALKKYGFTHMNAAFADAISSRSPEKLQLLIGQLAQSLDEFQDIHSQPVQHPNIIEIVPEDFQIMQRYNPERDEIERFVPRHLMHRHQGLFENYQERQVRVRAYEMHEDLHAELLNEITQFFIVLSVFANPKDKKEKEITNEKIHFTESLKDDASVGKMEALKIDPKVAVPLRIAISAALDKLLKSERQWNEKMMEDFEEQIASELKIKKEAVNHFIKNDETVKKIILSKQKDEFLLKHPENLSRFNQFVNALYESSEPQRIIIK